MIYSQKQINLHTHSFYCGHGTGELHEYVECALQKNVYKVLGFSEHCPTPFDCLPSRMPYSSLSLYIKQVRELKKNTENLTILLGAECDWEKKFAGFYEDELKGKEKFDYLIGSIHFMKDPDDGVLKYLGFIKNSASLLPRYTKQYIEMLESGLFLHGCHPDVFAAGLPVWTEDAKAASRDIAQAAKALNIPLEVNGYGFRKPQMTTPGGIRFIYPIKEFWEIAADEGVDICFNTDAHHVNHLHPSEEVWKFADELGIKFIDWEINENGIFAGKTGK